MIKRLRGIRILLLLAAMAAGILTWKNFARQAAEEESQAAMAIQISYALEQVEDREAGLVFLMPLEAGDLSEDAPLPAFGLRWIQFSEENDGPHYALFLPAAAQTTGLRAFLGDIRLTLDDEPLANGQQLALTAGEHLLVAEDGPEPGREWEFVVMYGSEIPCVFIETVSGSLDAICGDEYKEYSESASVTLLDANGSLEYTGSIEAMRGRGNATWDFPEKKPFQIKLTEKTSLLGMSSARRWLLIGNAFDRSLLRNQTAFALAREVGLPFTPESRQVDLYINGGYYGCFLLCEKIEVDSGRVDIYDLDEANQKMAERENISEQELPVLTEQNENGVLLYTEPEISAKELTGGYLIEVELTERFLGEERCGFITRQGQAVSIRSPSPASREQTAYIAALYQQLEDLIYPAEEDGPVGELEQIIDLHSFAQKYLVEEIVKNHDAASTSQFFYKMPDRVDTRLFAGPVWDYDVSLAGAGFPWGVPDELKEPVGWWANQPIYDYSIWAGLYRQPAFREAVKDSFFEEFVPVIEQMLDESWISWDGRRILDSARMDALRWQGGAYDEDAFVQEYQQDVALIENFLAARMEFLKAEWAEERQ